MNRRSAVLIFLVLGLPLFSCDESATDGSTLKISVEFFNESQFTVESLFLHDQPLNYKEQTDLLKAPLAPGTSITDMIPARSWYVTVYRRPNQDSDVLAYTTATAWDSLKYQRIFYYDEQFRVEVAP